MAKLTTDEILAYLEEATILELNELVKAIEEKFDVTAAAPVAVAAAAEEEGPAANVTVILKEVGPTKVKVIKAVREITGLGLVDAKKLVDGVPAEIKKDIAPEEAAEIKKKLEDAGIERVEVDTRSEKLGYKLREAQLMKIPYMLVVGDKEAENGTVSVRRRGEGDIGTKSVNEFLNIALDEIKNKTIR